LKKQVKTVKKVQKKAKKSAAKAKKAEKKKQIKQAKKVIKKKVVVKGSSDDETLKKCNALLATGKAKLADLKKREAAAHKLYMTQRKAHNKAFRATHKLENKLEEEIDAFSMKYDDCKAKVEDIMEKRKAAEKRKQCSGLVATGKAQLAALKKKEAAAHKLYISQRKARNMAFRATHKLENKLEEEIDAFEMKLDGCKDIIHEIEEKKKAEEEKKRKEEAKKKACLAKRAKIVSSLLKKKADFSAKIAKLKKQLKALNKQWKTMRKAKNLKFRAVHKKANGVEEQIDKLEFVQWDLLDDIKDAKAKKC